MHVLLELSSCREHGITDLPLKPLRWLTPRLLTAAPDNSTKIFLARRGPVLNLPGQNTLPHAFHIGPF